VSRLASSKLISRWLIATLALSILAMLDHGLWTDWLALEPARVWQGQLWRLVTWVLVEPRPFSLFITCACLHEFGDALAHHWGERRLRRYMRDVIVGAAVVTALVALASAQLWRASLVGGRAVGDALTIAWARQYPERELHLGLLRLRGRDLIAVTIGMTCVWAFYFGPLALLPDLVACAAAYYYPRSRLAGAASRR
jgi:hypothetical protein